MDEIHVANGTIGQNRITVQTGDMTRLSAQAYVVPQFTDAMSDGGVGEAVLRDASAGMNEYAQHVITNGPQKIGSVLVTGSGGGNAAKLLHATTINFTERTRPAQYQEAFYNVLKAAEANGIDDVVAPALGTGPYQHLTHEQSALAMMSAIHRYDKEGGKPVNVIFAIHENQPLFETYAKTLDSRKYADEAVIKALLEEKPLAPPPGNPVVKLERAAEAIAGKSSNRGKWVAGIVAGAAIAAGAGWLWHVKQREKEEEARQAQTPAVRQ